MINKRVLILDNNRTGKISVNSMKDALKTRKVYLEHQTSTEDEDDTIYAGKYLIEHREYEICLRTIHIDPDEGEDPFYEKLERVINNYNPDIILCHLSLYGRYMKSYAKFCSVIGMQRIGIRADKVTFYTGTCNDNELFHVMTRGKFGYNYNELDINKQVDIIMKKLQ